MKTKPRSKSFFELTDAERDEYVKQFDQEFIADTFRPMTPAERTRWERIRRKPGRPKEGAGAKVISVSIEQGLLETIDRLAQQKKVTRARLIARGLRALLAAEGLTERAAGKNGAKSSGSVKRRSRAS